MNSSASSGMFLSTVTCSYLGSPLGEAWVSVKLESTKQDLVDEVKVTVVVLSVTVLCAALLEHMNVTGETYGSGRGYFWHSLPHPVGMGFRPFSNILWDHIVKTPAQGVSCSSIW